MIDTPRTRLQHVRWIGGGTGAGKSTIARRLARAHGLRVYDSDRVIGEHARRSTALKHPLVHRFMATDMDERWVKRSPAVMLETFHGFQGEGFEFVVEDLLALPNDAPILGEAGVLLELSPLLVVLPLCTKPPCEPAIACRGCEQPAR